MRRDAKRVRQPAAVSPAPTKNLAGERSNLLQICRSNFRNPVAVTAAVPDRSLTLSEAVNNPFDLFGCQLGPRAQHSGNLLGFFLCCPARTLGERNLFAAESQVCFGDAGPDLGSALERILDVALAGEHVPGREHRRRAVEQEPDLLVDVGIDFALLGNSRNRLRNAADRTYCKLSARGLHRAIESPYPSVGHFRAVESHPDHLFTFKQKSGWRAQLLELEEILAHRLLENLVARHAQ